MADSGPTRFPYPGKYGSKPAPIRLDVFVKPEQTDHFFECRVMRRDELRVSCLFYGLRRTSSNGKKLLHLQGLRGVAILSVVAFHFFPEHCKNGYLGVDIFFLLSGYLMTMMLDRLKHLGILELIEFWYRRLKRIVPFYYLATFAIIVCLYFSSGIVRSANYNSAFHAVTFSTNLVGNDGYFEKLGLAVDMFTHTWSLALEIQFYLIFPIIFVAFKLLPDQVAPLFVVIIGISSLLYQLTSDKFTSFNSVFARIWQFLTGTIAFYVDDWFSPKKNCSDYEKENLLPDTIAVPQKTVSEKVLMSSFILALIFLLALPQDVNPLYVRINSILVSCVIVAYGRNSLLENGVLAFIGEISYGWYLIHWPVYALFKMNDIKDERYLLVGVLLSFLLSMCLHYAFEKQYLGWSKTTILCSIFLLLLLNGVGLVNMKRSFEFVDTKLNGTVILTGNESNKLDPNFYYPYDFLDNIAYGFENMTNKERMKLNEEYDSGDRKRITQYCKNYTKTKYSAENRCVMNYNVNKTANATLLIIGNSWAGNLMQTVSEACGNRFSNMVTVFQTGCNPLISSFEPSGKYKCDQEDMFLDAIKELKPDVVLFIARYWPRLVEGYSPLNDKRFKGSQFEIDIRYMIIKQRLARLAAKCKKCRIFDFATQFWFNGTFKLYEPKYLVSFMSTPVHFTPAAWVRVKPLLKYECDNA